MLRLDDRQSHRDGEDCSRQELCRALARSDTPGSGGDGLEPAVGVGDQHQDRDSDRTSRLERLQSGGWGEARVPHQT